MQLTLGSHRIQFNLLGGSHMSDPNMLRVHPQPPDHVHSDSGHPRRHPYTHLTMQKSDELLEANDNYDHNKNSSCQLPVHKSCTEVQSAWASAHSMFLRLTRITRKNNPSRATWKKVSKHLRLIMVCVSLTSQRVVEATFKFGFGERGRTMCSLRLR